MDDLRRAQLAASLLRSAPTVRKLTDDHVLAILRARTQAEMTALKNGYALTWQEFNAIQDQQTPQARRVAGEHGIPDVAAMAGRVIAGLQHTRIGRV